MCNVANNGGKWIAPRRRKAIYLRDDLKCVYCGDGIETEGFIFTLDHLIPQELGGTNETKNLVTACKACNSAKGAKSLRQFLVYLESKGVKVERIKRRIRRNRRRKLKGNFRI